MAASPPSSEHPSRTPKVAAWGNPGGPRSRLSDLLSLCVRLGMGALVSLAGPAGAADLAALPQAPPEAPSSWAKEGALRLSLQSGFDSNVRRDYEEAELPPQGDGFASLILSADGSLVGERVGLSGGYVGGARKFFELGREDVLSQAMSLEGSSLIGRSLSLGVEGNGKDRRGGARDYTSLSASAFADYVPDRAFSLRLRAGAERFLYRPNLDYSFGGATGGATLRFRMSRRHAVSAFGFVSSRRFLGRARNAEGGLREGAPRREDTYLEGGASYAFRGPFAFTATYSYGESRSSSFGEAWRRHRVALTAGIRLPFELMLLSQIQAQLASYPDGFLVSPEILLQEDEENANSAALKLVRPLSKHLDVEARFAAYRNRLEEDDRTFFRHVSWMGFTLRF